MVARGGIGRRNDSKWVTSEGIKKIPYTMQGDSTSIKYLSNPCRATLIKSFTMTVEFVRII